MPGSRSVLGSGGDPAHRRLDLADGNVAVFTLGERTSTSAKSERQHTLDVFCLSQRFTYAAVFLGTMGVATAIVSAYGSVGSPAEQVAQARFIRRRPAILWAFRVLCPAIGAWWPAMCRPSLVCVGFFGVLFFFDPFLICGVRYLARPVLFFRHGF